MAKQSNYRIFSAFSPHLGRIREGLYVLENTWKEQLESPNSPLKTFLLVYFICLFCIFTYTAYNLYGIYKKVEVERKNEIEKMLYWEEILAQNPSYPDAYYQAAYHALRLGFTDRAQKHIARAIFLDPTFTEAKELSKHIGEKNY